MANEQVLAVLDTNVILSAALTPKGIPAYALAAGAEDKYLICYSDEIIEEYREVLARGKFKIPKKSAEALVAGIKKAGQHFIPQTKVSVSPDPDDYKFLECAQEAKAHYLVTGNRRHFPDSHGKTKVVTPREFVTILISAGII